MINDPLLHTTTDAPPTAPVTRTARTGARKKHPAISARILAVGLSTTALIGLTTGYTLAQKAPVAQPAISESSITNVAQKSPIDAGVITQTSQVVYVPVPAASAATAGTPSVQVQAPAPAATTQKSSGSN
jgi:hypothetical protein